MHRFQIFVRTAIAATVLAVLSLVGGCNTVEGVGKDLSGAGQGLADLASDINPDNS